MLKVIFTLNPKKQIKTENAPYLRALPTKPTEFHSAQEKLFPKRDGTKLSPLFGFVVITIYFVSLLSFICKTAYRHRKKSL